MYTCENCKIVKNEKWSSGRFCSLKCSRSFSTKRKRTEINEKVSKKLSSNHYKIYCIMNCEICNNVYEVTKNHRNQKTCSHSCSAKLKWENVDYRKKSQERLAINTKKSFGTKCSFLFKEDSISCDSLKEKEALEKICKNYTVKTIRRCHFCIDYFWDGKNRKYNPDFIIETEDKIFILEVKTSIGKGDKSSRPHYFYSIESKKEALKKYCNENNANALWYDTKFTEL